MHKRSAILLLSVIFMGIALVQTGCTRNGDTAAAKSTEIKSALKRAGKETNAATQIRLLRSACTGLDQLNAAWPDSKESKKLLAKYGAQLSHAPATVYELSIKAKDLESFKWAVARSVKVDTYHTELLKIWECGPDWRDSFISAYPKEALPLFMNRAIETHNIKFFDAYVGAFKATGFVVRSPLETTEFNARFCRFLAEAFDAAMDQTDPDRIEFLLDHTPTFGSVIYIDSKTKETMRALGDYICHELKDETLALKLIALGYELNRIDLSKAGFGPEFGAELAKNPQYAVSVLELGTWHGALSEQDAKLLIELPFHALESVAPMLIDEGIEYSIKAKNSAAAIRLIEFRETKRPLNRFGYDELLRWATQYGNPAIFEYVTEECDYMNTFGIKFIEMAAQYGLFVKYAPDILNKVHPTMDRHAADDGITFGIVYDVLASRSHEAGLYIVKNYDWGDAWTEATGGRTLLMAVCQGGNLEAAKYLIENRGASIQDCTDYTEQEQSIFGNTRAVEGKLSPLFFAATSGNCDLISYLISKGANVNDQSNYGATPLMYAVSAGRLEAVKLLLSRGARVNAEMNPNLSGTDLKNMGSYADISTAYRRARTMGRQDILHVLESAGARP